MEARRAVRRAEHQLYSCAARAVVRLGIFLVCLDGAHFKPPDPICESSPLSRARGRLDRGELSQTKFCRANARRWIRFSCATRDPPHRPCREVQLHPRLLCPRLEYNVWTRPGRCKSQCCKGQARNLGVQVSSAPLPCIRAIEWVHSEPPEMLYVRLLKPYSSQ